MSGSDTSAPDDGTTVDYWQVAFAVLALVGLVLAAFATPVALVDAPETSGSDDDLGSGDPGSGDSGDGDPGGGERPGDEPDDSDPDDREDDDGDDGMPGLFEWLLQLLGLLETDSEPPEEDGTEPCLIVLDSEPTPGSDLTVTVLSGDEPVQDASVWFDDRYVGETDEAGQVTGEVPYRDELDVRVASEELSDCEEVVDTTGAPSVTGDSLTATFEAALLDDGAPLAGRADEDGNLSITRPVEGSVEIEVLDRPYPGEDVEIEASISGVPMQEAEVSVADDPVAETDDEGRATIQIPDDRSDQVPVTVSRGDFSGSETFDVYLLEATLRPAGLVLVPAGEATVIAEKQDEPAVAAGVTVEDEYAGTTNRAGEQAVVLPADPTEPVTVSTNRQTTSVSLFDLYWFPLTVLGVLTAITGGIARHYYGRPGLLAVLGTVGALATVVVAGGYWWPEGSLLAAGAFAALGLGALLVTYRRTVRKEAVTVGGFLVRLLEALVARILWVVGFLEQLLDYAAAGVRVLFSWTRSLLGRLRSLPRSLPGLFARLTRWIGSLFARAAAAVRAILGDRRLAARAVVALLVGALAVGGGYHLDGQRGAGLAALGVVLVAALAWFVRWTPSRVPPEKSPDDSDDFAHTDDVSEVSSDPADEERWTLRQLWRAFASRVVPGRWRTRTPVEVSHAALQQGYPRTPVSELTTAFREVEYGNRTPTEAVRDRAARAYESLVGGTETTTETASPQSGTSELSGQDSKSSDRDSELSGRDHDRRSESRGGDQP